jgi:signal transduction histidine kinase
MYRKQLPQLMLAIPMLLATMLVAYYTWQYVAVLPWIGFQFNAYSGRITYIDTLIPEQMGLLHLDDQIIQINGIGFEDYTLGTRPSLMSLLEQDGLRLLVRRENHVLQLDWLTTDPPPLVRVWRIIQFIPAYALLLVLYFMFFFLRPLDRRYMLIILAFDLTLIWIVGVTVLPYNFFLVQQVTRSAIWLCVPVYMQFGWNIPNPVSKVPRYIPWVGFTVTALLIMCEWLGLLPGNMHLAFLFGGFTIGPILLFIHKRREPVVFSTRLVVLVIAIILVPLSLLFLVRNGLINSLSFYLLTITIPGAPLAILYMIYRRELGSLELRVNQAFILFLYTLLLLSLVTATATILHGTIPLPQADPPITVIVAVLAAMISIWAYPVFRKWALRALLGIPLLPERGLQAYAGRIATSLDVDRLAHLLCDEVFPSMLVREAMLLRLDENLQPVPLVMYNTKTQQIPKYEEVRQLLAAAGQYRNLSPDLSGPIPCPWVRLALVLRVEGRPVGLCLLGRRDPDDFYSMSEMPVLQSIMDQTALALNNIAQAERLHSFHQANIERHEAERMDLARELHDEVLGQMAVLAMNITSGTRMSEPFHEAYENATNHIRSIINGLRPTMISYGLEVALNELADEISTQSSNPPEIEIHFTGNGTRYPPEMEMHLYRIAQQACQNAVRHGRATRIQITGHLDPQDAQLLIDDNGQGFLGTEALDINNLLTHRHFGLVGIYERAALIGAKVDIDSFPGLGTRIFVHWRKNL